MSNFKGSNVPTLTMVEILSTISNWNFSFYSLTQIFLSLLPLFSLNYIIYARFKIFLLFSFFIFVNNRRLQFTTFDAIFSFPWLQLSNFKFNHLFVNVLIQPLIYIDMMSSGPLLYNNELRRIDAGCWIIASHLRCDSLLRSFLFLFASSVYFIVLIS